MWVVGLALFVLFLIGEAFFAAAEISLISVGEATLKKQAQKHIGARLALLLLKDPERLLSTTLLGLNLCVIANGVLTTGFLIELFPTYGAVLSMLILPPVMLLFGQIVPKNIARERSEKVALLLAPPLYLFSKAFLPVTFVVSRVVKKTVEGLGAGQKPLPSMIREELKGLFLSEENLEPIERRAFCRLFEFSGKTVGQVMVPLIQVKALPERAKVEEALRIFARYGFARIPVFRTRIYNMTGVVRAQDLLDAPKEALLSAYVRKVPYVPEMKPATEMLSEMQKSGEDFAIVVDEYGAAVGILTLEDLIEEILGEFWDELEMELKPYIQIKEGHYLIKAHTEVEKVQELGIDIPSGDYETVGGFVLKLCGRIPSSGETFRYGNWEIRVKKASPMAVEELEFVRVRDDES